MAIALNNSAIDRLLRDSTEEALTDVGKKITARAKEQAPVLTGYLRDHITFDPPQGEMTQCHVVSEASYSIYVHNGTRYQHANPYMIRGLMSVANSGS